MKQYELFHGDVLSMLGCLDDNSVDSLITDPPYELGFMGKAWDGTGIAYSVPMWKECLRVLKPGGHLLSFGGSRTYHRMASAIEDAGFEIRDQIMWVYGSGFPKSMDVSKAIDKAAGAEREVIGIKPGHEEFANRTTKGHIDFKEGTDGFDHPWMHDDEARAKYHQLTAPATAEAKRWEGWGTALKPAHEPIVLARKPLIGTVVANVLTHGTGALNIGASRIPGEPVPINKLEKWSGFGEEKCPDYEATVNNAGRWPANLIHDGSDEVMDEFAKYGESSSKARVGKRSGKDAGRFGAFVGQEDVQMGHSDSGTPARFFYCAKSNKKDRNEGCEGLEQKTAGEATDRKDGSAGLNSPRAGAGRTSGALNHHPTVKPTELMRYLCRIITPPNGIILDPFMGSGSTGKAAMKEGFRFIGIDKEEEYIKIATARIQNAVDKREVAA